MSAVTLTGRHVRLEPLSDTHVDGLAAAAAVDRATYGWTYVPDGREAMERYVTGLVADRAAGIAVPFAQVAADTGDVLGCTRLMELRWAAGRATPVEVEIGGTWLTAPAQRTPVNTEAKLLLLRHAFGELGVWRVAICTAAENTRSRTAIERLGAQFEGILRNHRQRMGDLGNPTGALLPRDSALYSITPDDWPAVEARLTAKLAERHAG